MAVAWDAPGPTFRHQAFEAYKIQRPGMPKDLVEQIPWIRKSLDVLGLPVLQVPGFEADDILATAVARLRRPPGPRSSWSPPTRTRSSSWGRR